MVHPETEACPRGHFAKGGVNIVRGVGEKNY